MLKLDKFTSVEKMFYVLKCFYEQFNNKNTFSHTLKLSKKCCNNSGKKWDISDKTLQTLNWLEDHSTNHGDRMPDTAKVVLPYKTVKSDVYLKHLAETRQCPLYELIQSVSHSFFRP
jgi:hypothetical protein